MTHPVLLCKTRSPSGALLSFLGEGSPTKLDYREKSGTLILTSLLEDPEKHLGFGRLVLWVPT